METALKNTGRIMPHRDLAATLNRVESPGRYVGGEFGSIVRSDPGLYRIALSFPDLYEIGMSNTAIKLLYGMLNSLPSVACERVFVPAPDFEEALAAAAVPLYTLETGTPVRDVDLLAVSYGYELLATNLLTLLQSSGCAVRARDRGDDEPLMIVGGPGATNPRPIAPFVDGVFVGEAEAAVPDLVGRLAAARERGAGRQGQLEILAEHPSVWVPGGGGATRAIWNGFGHGMPPTGISVQGAVPPSFGAGFPVPSIPVVQDHGPVEIMRGCPQGCRFCHAGVYYRPYRMKPVEQILAEVTWLVEDQGYRDITLSSLSSGDYTDLVNLLEELNRRFRHRGVSFQLPSLRVNSVTLPIFEQLSVGRRSGLTFAVETAGDAAQRSVNKRVPLDRTIAIAREAHSRGWQHAKLYFMIGLPIPDADNEASAIVEYVRELRRAVKMEFVVNVGTFVPKPHTPFERAPQLDATQAAERLEQVRANLPRGTRFRAHDPWLSWLEGVLTRGDERTAEAIERAHRAGARLDAWSEHCDRDAWATAIGAVPGSDSGTMGFDRDAAVPWQGVDLGVRNWSRRREEARAAASEVTDACAPECQEPCGVCNRETRVLDLPVSDVRTPSDRAGSDPANGRGWTSQPENTTDAGLLATQNARRFRIVVRYRKTGPSAFLPHLGVVRTFEKVWNRLGVPLELTEGYHPKARMSFGQPLPLGVASDDEILVVAVQKNIQAENIWQGFSSAVPAGFSIRGIAVLVHEPQAPRIPAPMQVYGSSEFEARGASAQIDRLEAVLGGHGVPVRGVNEVPDEVQDRARIVRFDLPTEAPGLGRIVKEGDLRGAVTLRRCDMRTADGMSVFAFFRGLPNCIASVSGEPET